jgi:hypothetical protein
MQVLRDLTFALGIYFFSQPASSNCLFSCAHDASAGIMLHKSFRWFLLRVLRVLFKIVLMRGLMTFPFKRCIAIGKGLGSLGARARSLCDMCDCLGW